ncbi:MAG: SDR family oxidoreductase [Paludibacteraceae bacterium]|nr:SDR family oxidoreductase [Paludibacteraceae bacterium]
MDFNPTYNPYSLQGKVVLVTGASSGIGRATAIECSKLGAQVIITARNEARLQETFNQLAGIGHQMILCDLANEKSIDQLAQLVPHLDGLVNNAGYQEYLPVPFIKKDKLEAIMSVNTIAPITLLQKLLRSKKITKGGSIVFTSSLAGLGINAPGNSMYAATKGAISAFITGAAIDLSTKKIRVNAVCPGMVNTAIMDYGTVGEEELKADAANYPLGRYGEPEDVAFAIIYLLSDASNWITGTNLVIDGGVSAK